MEHIKACAWAALAVWAGAAACTSKDSLIDDGGGSGMGAQSAGGSSGNGGSAGAQAGAGAKAGSSASGGSSAGSSASGNGGSSQGGSGGSGAGAGSSSGSGSGSGGAAAGTGGAAVGGGSGGDGSGGDGASSGAADGGTGGGSGAGTGGGGGASGACSEVTVLADCEARTDCHSVYQDPGTCGCASVGCCAKFSRCADGVTADCEGKALTCDALTPFCEAPAFVVSYSGFCYEGCVQPKDCDGAVHASASRRL